MHETATDIKSNYYIYKLMVHHYTVLRPVHKVTHTLRCVIIR